MTKDRVALKDVAWSFTGGSFPDRASFETSLMQQQQAFGSSGTFLPGELAILSPVVRVQYMCWEGDRQIEPVVTLTAENGAAFSVGDLLFQLHNAVVAQLKNLDHHFFEGLTLVVQQSGEQPPLYRLWQGS